jgi:ribosome-associated translation inhibitor RaiA
MEMNIRIKGLPGAAKLRRIAAEKLDVALARYAHAIQEANIRLDDINGPARGGVDKLCRVVLKLKDSSVVVVEELGTDIAQAIQRVADRLQQGVSRQLDRLVNAGQDGMAPRLTGSAA